MLKYLIVLLDESSVAYCHCDNPNIKPRPMSIGTLKECVTFAMKENLNVQFVWSNTDLSEEYLNVIDSIDHTNIVPNSPKEPNDIVVFNGITSFVPFSGNIVIRTKFEELFAADLSKILRGVTRLNVVVTDVEELEEATYSTWLEQIAELVKTEHAHNNPV